jgi:hypothetical protein
MKVAYRKLLNGRPVALVADTLERGKWRQEFGAMSCPPFSWYYSIKNRPTCRYCTRRTEACHHQPYKLSWRRRDCSRSH